MSAPAAHRPRPGQSISVASFDALPIDPTVRREIENGRYVEMNRPAGAHARAAARLVRLLDPQLPSELEAFAEPLVDLPVGRSPRRVPDVVIGPSDWDDTILLASRIALAIEIVSPGESASRDYITKPHEYAANGIPVTWVIDIQQDRVSLAEFVLGDTGEYSVPELEYGEFTGKVAGVSITIDLDALTGPKR
jgi:Uma2 family endonuclease